MKTLLAAAATVALLSGAGVASAQMYPQPAMNPTPLYQPMQPAQPMMQQPMTVSTPSWMQDDGSSSDHPIHNPDDVSGDRLNSQYQGGLTVPPGQGLPYPYPMR